MSSLLSHSRGKSARLATALLALLLGVTAGSPPAHADKVAELSQVLEKDRDEKTRISAVVALGRLADPASVPTLMRALVKDKSATVRSVAASALGHIRDERAIPALELALKDEQEGVRLRAKSALESVRSAQAAKLAAVKPEPAKPLVAKPDKSAKRTQPVVRVLIKAMANRTKGPKDLPKRMREFVVAELGRAPELDVDGQESNTLKTFVIDGSVVTLKRQVSGPWTEVSCEVKITVSTEDGRIVSIVNGGATVQTAKGSFKPDQEKGMQVEALENAVRGAQENLVTFLSRQARI